MGHYYSNDPLADARIKRRKRRELERQKNKRK